MAIPSVYADELDVQTSKKIYSLTETVHISGELTLGGSPVTDGLVAIQIQRPEEIAPLVIRTRSTGSIPEPWKIRITNFYSCDGQGNPKDSFKRETAAYFWVEYENLDEMISRFVLITINVFDQENQPIGASFIGFSVPPKKTSVYLTPVEIPEEASVGQAVAYANAYTEWPREDGYPYCAEVAVTFTITDGGSGAGSSSYGGSTGTTVGMNTPGSYDLSFSLPYKAKLGDYTVYARARYGASATTTFDFVWLFTDLDRNGKVDIRDVTIAARAYLSEPGDPRWNPKADLDENGLINIIDISKIARDYQKIRP